MREMKDSGIEWVGNIPNNWIMKPYRNIITQRDGGAWGTDPTEDNQMICMRIANFDYEKFKFSSKPIENLTKRKYTKRQILNLSLQSGDILIEKSGGGEKTPVGRAIIFDKEYPALFANFMDRIRVNNNEVIPRFVVYWLGAWYGCKGSPYFINQTTGIQNIALTLFLAKAHICYPKLEDQQAIANFLDAKCADIDSLTGDIQKQIDILKEYKKSVITQAVTKGLDPNVEMKDSGIYGADKIPKHWKIKRNKFISTSLSKGNGITKDQVIQNGDTECIRYGEIYTKYDKEAISIFSHTNLNLIDKPRFCRYGDILFTCTGELIEEIGKNIVYLGNKKCMVGGDIIIMQHSENPKFLNYALSSSYSKNQKSKGKAKLKVVHISSSDIGNILIALPPLKEQQVIADYLDAKCADIDAIISGKQKQLDVLKEYKKSLIYEYVTGKKEVPCHE